MIDEQILCGHDVDNINLWSGAPKSGLASSEEYLKLKIFNTYPILSLKDLFLFLKDHPDTYLITDSKFPCSSAFPSLSNDDYNRKFWRILVNEARSIDPALLNRVVPQLYYPEMKKIIDDIHPFNSYIFTLYASGLSTAEVLNFLKREKTVKAVTMWKDRINEIDLVNGIGQLKRRIYVHTVNDPNEVADALKKGAYGAYTDFVSPDSLGY